MEHELKIDISASLSSSVSSEESISSSQEEHELKQIPSQTAQNDLESTSDSSKVSEYQKTSGTPSEGFRIAENSLSDSSYQPISNSDIDYMIARLNDEEGESKEEYPSAPYELRFYNCKKEHSESKRVEDVELDELVYSDVLGETS